MITMIEALRLVEMFGLAEIMLARSIAAGNRAPLPPAG